MSTALRAIADDIARTTALHPDLNVGEDENGFFIRVGDGSGSSTTWSLGDEPDRRAAVVRPART